MARAMPNASPDVDAYIARAPEYSRDILQRVRDCFHRACPQIEESIKWGCPHFGHKGIVGSMAAFKEYVKIGFWKGKLLDDPPSLFTVMGKTTMSFRQVADASELPADKVFIDYIRRAVTLNIDGIKGPSPKRKPKPKLTIPSWFVRALKQNKKALATFEAFSPSHQREYVEWLTEARQQATRQKRLATAIEWLAEGKPRNWKYMQRK